jgi:hypothetical protein
MFVLLETKADPDKAPSISISSVQILPADENACSGGLMPPSCTEIIRYMAG